MCSTRCQLAEAERVVVRASAPAIIAHRGAAAEAPENTLAAFDLAVELGADALELDVRRAGDGALAVIHDPTVERTTRGHGAVASYASAGLRELGVPTLEEVFGRYPELEMTVDVKDPAATAEVAELIGRFGSVDRTILYVEEGTEHPAFADYPGRRATSVGQAAWLGDESRARGGGAVALPEDFPEVVHAPLDGPEGPIVTPDLVAVAHANGRTVHVWTIDDIREMRELATGGVDGIITNDVRQAVELFQE